MSQPSVSQAPNQGGPKPRPGGPGGRPDRIRNQFTLEFCNLFDCVIFSTLIFYVTPLNKLKEGILLGKPVLPTTSRWDSQD